jgi:arylsulfatase
VPVLNGVPNNLQANLAMLDELGGPKTYGHYPNGWAMAFNTPFKRWKSYEFNGGTAEPAGDGLEGAVAEQFSGGRDD